MYIAKLVRQDGTAGANQIPFIVRDDDGHSDIVFQTDDATWQAYNTWGSSNLYGSNSGVTAAPAVSYNRPIDTTNMHFYIDMELPAIMWLEKNGYDISYTTDVDTARNGAELLDHKVFLSVGKDEYWSAEQVTNVEAARDAGVNLQFWTGNDIFWKTQWKPSIDGSDTDYRTLITYKETQRGTINPDGVWTGLWSDPNAPDGVNPPNELTGNIFAVLQTDPYLGNDRYSLRANTVPVSGATLVSQIPNLDIQLRCSPLIWGRNGTSTLIMGSARLVSSTYPKQLLPQPTKCPTTRALLTDPA